jgi:toxin-antitoxin system PIN domain toxin
MTCKEMKHLCDSNVFIALTLEAHPHGKRATRWVDSLAEGGILYFCRSTQQSYLRLLTVKEWMKEEVCTNDEAMKAYTKLTSDPRIQFSEEPRDLETQWLAYARGPVSSPKRWMDAYLAAFAQRARMCIVTFDRGFLTFPGLDLIVL